ncbi:MAG: FAD-dependent oxidoreductase, partial [Ignavibacteriae bacterium]|nr:FAD-dependent oxidoreductase [Ignavibacteriota bacterium]
NLEKDVLEFDKALISIGRTPVSKGLGLENTNVKINERGYVLTDNKCQTDEPSIFAIGDIVGGAMLAHKASAEGKVAVEAIAGHKVAFEPNAIPAVVFTDPEVAWAGLTELEAKEKGIKVKVTRFPWAASGRAMTMDRNDGLTKLIIEPETERILGVGIVGPGAGELIAEGTLAIEMAALAKDVALTIHAHPTLSETMMESAEVFFGQATHLYRPKRK